jgi:hypothetical protein
MAKRNAGSLESRESPGSLGGLEGLESRSELRSEIKDPKSTTEKAVQTAFVVAGSIV